MMKKRIFTKIIAVAMTFIMMMSLFAPIVSAAWTHDGHTHDKNEINYVSLGDSMTNGYGLPGYDSDTGVEDYGDGSYANQFANWLELMGNDVNHSQLAMSAMRAEDLHWLLEVDYTNKDQLDAADMEDWDADKWAAAFPTTGDYWTWHEISDDYRLANAAAYILAETAWGAENYPEYVDDAKNLLNSNVNGRWDICNETEIGAKYYQEAVANADIISLGMGNGNFGVFMLGRITDAIGFGGSPEDTLVYDIDRALATLDPALQVQVRALIDDLYAAVEGYTGMALDDGNDENVTMMESLANTVVYTAISFVLNYIGSVDAILTLNPDAEIILIGLMNTFGEAEGTEISGFTLGSLLDKVYEPLNIFIAGLPAVMQATGNSAYSDATFYYAEAADIESLSQVYRDEMEKDGSVIRERFVSDIVGSAENPGMIWGMLGGIEFPGGVKLSHITFGDVVAYDEMTDEQRAGVIANAVATADSLSLSKYISCAVYLALEDAIIRAGNNMPITINSVLGLGTILGGDVFGDVMSAFGTNAAEVGKAKLEVAATVVAGGSERLTAEAVQNLVNGGETAIYNAAYGIVAEGFEGLDADDVKEIYDDNTHIYYGRVKAGVDEAVSTLSIAVGSANMLCTALSIPEALSASLVADETVGSLLGLFARCLLASGIGNHPSTGGHGAIFEAVKTSYEEGHTAQDEILDTILPILNKYYMPKYAELVANGSMDALKAYVTDAKGAIVSANNALNGFEVNADLEALKPLLSKELAALEVTLDKLIALIDTADALDADTWAALMDIESDLDEHINNVQAIAKEIEFIATPYVEKAIEAVKYYSSLIEEISNDVYDAVVLGAEEFKKLYLEFVEVTCAQVGKISPALADAVRESLIDAPKDAVAILYAYGEDVVIKLCLAVADASDELYDAVVTLAALATEYGWEIYSAIKNTPEYETAVDSVKALSEKLGALYEEAKNAPLSTALAYEQKIAELKGELEAAYASLYELVFASLEAVKPGVALMLEDALENVEKSVLGLVDIGDEYSEWFILRSGNMLGDLLMSVAEHTENIGSAFTAAAPDVKSFIFDVLSDLGEYINNAVADVELMIKAEINELSDALAELKSELAARQGKEIETLSGGEFMSYSFRTLADGASSADEDDRTIGDALGDLSDLVVAEIEERIAAIEQKIAELQAALEDSLVKSIAEIESLIDEISQDVDEIVDYITTEGSILLDNTIKDLVDAAQSLKQSGIEIISAAYEQLTAEVKKILDRTLYFDYTVSSDSNYLAIGSFAQKENYATILADKLGGINVTTFNNSGYRLADLRALLDEDFVNDAYGDKYFSQAKAKRGNTLVEDIKAADIITVDLGMADFTSFATNQIIAMMVSELDELKDVFEQFMPGYFDSYTMYDMDWSYFGELGEEIDVEAAVDYVFEEFLDENLPETVDIRSIVDLGITINVPCEVSVKELARYAVEVYLYALANYAYNYWATVEAIQAVNPDAQLVLLGAYNMLDGFVFEVEDFTLDMTYVGEALMRVASALRFATSVAKPGVVYVDVEDAGSELSETEITDLFTFDSDTMQIAFNADILGIKGDKNEYVANQVFEAIDVTCEHIYDDCEDAECNFCGETREAPGHVYDDCEDIACNICGALRDAQKHVYDEDCTDTTCNVCGKLRDAQSAHKYDDCEDTDCNNKGCKVTRTAPGHTFGEWVVLKEATLTEEGEKQRTCTECGYTETAVIEKLVSTTPEDDGKDDDVPADDGDPEENKGFPIWLLCLILLMVLALMCVNVWFVFIRKTPQPEPVEEEPVEEEPVEEPEEEEELDITVEDLDLIVLPDEEEAEDGVEVIDVVWTENSAKKIYKYDPNGMTVERGDVIRVPSRDVAKNRDVIRKVMVARGNHKVAPETLKHPLKKVDSVVSRYADDANN